MFLSCLPIRGEGRGTTVLLIGFKAPFLSSKKLFLVFWCEVMAHCTIEVYLFFALFFLNDGAPKPKMVGNRTLFLYMIIVFMYIKLGHGIFHPI